MLLPWKPGLGLLGLEICQTRNYIQFGLCRTAGQCDRAPILPQRLPADGAQGRCLSVHGQQPALSPSSPLHRLHGRDARKDVSTELETHRCVTAENEVVTPVLHA